MKPVLLLFSLLLTVQCVGQNVDVQSIVDECIKVHGGDQYLDAHYRYNFRDVQYEYHYDNGIFSYELHYKDGKSKDVLSNNGFQRLVNGNPIELSEKDQEAYTVSVNSVHYYVFLPFFLNDPAVNKTLLGEVSIKGKNYYKIEVTFNEEGGGIDHKDVHMYWINKETNTMDYLAYLFHMKEGGVRFRAAYNRRTIGGIVFQDFMNYTHEKDTPLSELDALYEQDKLKHVSKIEWSNIKKL